MNKMVQAQSMSKYIQDIWFVALLTVVFHDETNFVLPFLWIFLQMIIVICVQIIMRKTGPNPIIPFIIPTSVLLLLFLFNTPLWLYIIGTGISIWRIQIRFNKIQDEQTVESSYNSNFFLLFLIVHFCCFMLGVENYIFPLYSVVVLGIVFFISARLFTVWISTNKQNSASLSQVLSGLSIGLLSVLGLSTVLYFTIPFIRTGFGFLLVKVLSVATIPLIPILEYLDRLLDRVNLKTLEETERSPEEQLESEPYERVFESVDNIFPFEIVFFIIAIIVILLFVRLLLKNKPDKLPESTSVIHYLNKDLEDEEEGNQSKSSLSLYNVDTSLLREKYQAFELEASLYAYNRSQSETVRDWFQRMEWVVPEEFFQVYEEVRYGGLTITSKKAELFQSHLVNIKNTFFFKKDV